MVTVWLLMLLLLRLRLPLACAEICSDCAARRMALSDAELTRIRIDHIKEDILRKLRLKEPPTVQPNVPATLPEPLTFLSPSFSGLDGDTEAYEDDMYGKVDRMVVFPVDGGGSWCNPTTNPSTLCFRFQLPADLTEDSVTSADLWLYKDTSDNDTATVDEFIISEVAVVNDDGASLFTQKITTMRGWVNTDLGHVVKKWLRARTDDSYHTVYVACPTCPLETTPPISFKADQKPFLVLNIDTLNRTHRRKRSADCAPGTNDCCREHLNISFSAIGWNWILTPPYYDAYYCKGSCSTVSSISESYNLYHNVVKKWKYNTGGVVSSCCTPHKLGSLQILYQHDGQLLRSKLPDMIVEECACS